MLRYPIAAASIAVPLASATAQSDEGPPRRAANIARKQQVSMHGIPAPYASARDPLLDSEAKLRRGPNAVRCALHRLSWMDRPGFRARSLRAGSGARRPRMARSDAEKPSERYIYWSITEGGRQFESDTPAFRTGCRRRTFGP
jgi:hypothetical protein